MFPNGFSVGDGMYFCPNRSNGLRGRMSGITCLFVQIDPMVEGLNGSGPNRDRSSVIVPLRFTVYLFFIEELEEENPFADEVLIGRYDGVGSGGR